MKIQSASIILLAFITMYSACGDSATEITGTLPIVDGITVDSIVSTGDTIVVNWAPLTTVQIEGYLFWSRVKPGEPWTLIDVVYQNTATHIADRSAYYTVMAFNGDDTSSDTGLSDNTRTDEVSQIRQYIFRDPVGFRVDTEGDSLISGDPALQEFHQQFTVALDTLSGDRYIYPGSSHPLLWPGGMDTGVSLCAGFVAPVPGDSIQWRDSIRYGANFFLALDNGFYCKLNGSYTDPDTLTGADTLLITGEIQPIRGVRIFNQNW
jgi:hypothetical protein